MNCRHCGMPNPDLPSGAASADFVCRGCGTQLFSQPASSDLQETCSAGSDSITNFELPDRFQIIEVVGQGSFGIVSKCWDTLLQREVAVKFPREGRFQKRLFLREARAASRLQHENIVRILEIGEHQGHVFIVSEYVNGQTLRSWLDSDVHTTDDILRLMIKIARGIEYAHEMGVIHRDLKPGNIMVGTSGEPRVLDFGLSRSLSGDEDSIMKAGQQIGTPAFMSPEQVRGDIDAVDATTDVYSLGVIMFQMLVRQLPYSGPVGEVFRAIVADTSPPSLRLRNRSIPAPLDAICLKAMDKRQQRRYQSAAEFADDIQSYLEGHSILAYKGLHSRRVRKIARRNWLASAALFSSFAAIGGGWWIAADYRARNPMTSVVMESDSPETRLVWTRYDPLLGIPITDERVVSTAGKVARLRSGFYRVIAESRGEVADVFRSVPDSVETAQLVNFQLNGYTVPLKHRSSIRNQRVVELPAVKVLPAAAVRNGMEFVPGGVVSSGDDFRPLITVLRETRKLEPFLIDTKEVTWGQIVDTWPEFRLAPDQSPESPVEGIAWDVAVAWAEENGKSLPSVWELQFASTNGGTTRFPSGDELPEPASGEEPGKFPADRDRTGSVNPVWGLVTGRHEWTEDPFVPLQLKNGKKVPFEFPGGRPPPGMMVGQFPNSWLVFAAINTSDPERISPFLNVTNASDAGISPNLGFRTVRRLFNSGSF